MVRRLGAILSGLEEAGRGWRSLWTVERWEVGIGFDDHKRVGQGMFHGGVFEEGEIPGLEGWRELGRLAGSVLNVLLVEVMILEAEIGVCCQVSRKGDL